MKKNFLIVKKLTLKKCFGTIFSGCQLATYCQILYALLKMQLKDTSMQRMQIWVGLYSQYNASLPGYSYLSLFSISFLFCMGMATIQLWLRTWFGVLASSARYTQLSQQDTAQTIMTTSLEMLQVKPFGSKRYPSDLVRHLCIP